MHSGETASGKSENRCLAIKSLLEHSVSAPEKKRSKLTQQVPAASFRFGAYTELQFSHRSRLPNLHIFYYLVASASPEERAHLNLLDKSTVRCLGPHHTSTPLKLALKTIGLNKRHVAHSRDSDAAVVRNVDLLHLITDFLGVLPAALEASLAYRTKLVKKELYIVVSAEGPAALRGRIEKGTVDALVHELVFATVFLQTPCKPEEATRQGKSGATMRSQCCCACHCFSAARASRRSLCAAPDTSSLGPHRRSSTACACVWGGWRASICTSTDPDAWEDFRAGAFPDVFIPAPQPATSGMPVSTSMQAMYALSPVLGAGSPTLGTNTVSPRLDVPIDNMHSPVRHWVTFPSAGITNAVAFASFVANYTNMSDAESTANANNIPAVHNQNMLQALIRQHRILDLRLQNTIHNYLQASGYLTTAVASMAQVWRNRHTPWILVSPALINLNKDLPHNEAIHAAVVVQ
ncbi:hypothetical protein DFH07DRAFT_961268 [Mycena maculata]|uniref:Uncharacterized protein n=1 Tax=Mycena maculata TaxID=230809 RepID=A0AAD7N8U7_9AGAR|nr:hypothetical protein DFH07DRAFT_961268 [Mycena maculata]